MIVSIHQPNYLPWIGLFDKIKHSEIFVLMDDVQFPRGKKHFGHRNLIKTNAGSKWLTIPLLNKSKLLSFNEIEINNNGWNKKHCDLIKQFYINSKYFSLYYDDLESILMNEKHKTLLSLGEQLIRWGMDKFGINNTKILYSSNLAKECVGQERIEKILLETKATKYISGTGPGSMKYIDKDRFSKLKIDLEWQYYKHPIYKQLHGEFLPYMSFIDLLFNEGINSKNIL